MDRQLGGMGPQLVADDRRRQRRRPCPTSSSGTRTACCTSSTARTVATSRAGRRRSRQHGTAIDSTPAVGDLFKQRPAGDRRRHSVRRGCQPAGRRDRSSTPNGSLHCVFRTRDYFNIWANSPGPGRLHRRRVLVAGDRRHQRRRLPRHRVRWRSTCTSTRSTATATSILELDNHRGHRVVVARAVRHQR